MTAAAIWADERTLGLRCAKIEYGTELIDDVLQGYHYHGRDGKLIRRMRRGQVFDDDTCERCECPLDICNACEVTV
jgi:hypothetical protein